MSPRRRLAALLAIAALLSLALILSVAQHIRAVETGPEIVLTAEAYDPRDLLSGHYARLQFGISTHETADAGHFDGKDIFVGLAPEAAGGWRIERLAEREDGLAGLTAIRAKATRWGPNRIRLLYGIERLYAQQAEAIAIERRLQQRDAAPVKLVAALGEDHRLRIKAIQIDGERRDFEWW